MHAVIKRLGIEKLADRPYGKLSGGQKRQVQFAMAIAGRPELLFLDEPTVGLDVQARSALWQVLRDLIHEGCSIVLTTHYIEEAEALADRVAVVTQRPAGGQWHRRRSARPRIAQEHLVPHHPAARDSACLARGSAGHRGVRPPAAS